MITNFKNTEILFEEYNKLVLNEAQSLFQFFVREPNTNKILAIASEKFYEKLSDAINANLRTAEARTAFGIPKPDNRIGTTSFSVKRYDIPTSIDIYNRLYHKTYQYLDDDDVELYKNSEQDIESNGVFELFPEEQN